MAIRRITFKELPRLFKRYKEKIKKEAMATIKEEGAVTAAILASGGDAIVATVAPNVGLAIKAIKKRGLGRIDMILALPTIAITAYQAKQLLEDWFNAGWEFKETEEGWEIINEAPFSALWEIGTPPIKVDFGLLKKWAAHLLNEPEDSPRVRKLAFMIRREIRERGIQPVFILDKELKAMTDRVREKIPIKIEQKQREI